MLTQTGRTSEHVFPQEIRGKNVVRVITKETHNGFFSGIRGTLPVLITIRDAVGLLLVRPTTKTVMSPPSTANMEPHKLYHQRPGHIAGRSQTLERGGYSMFWYAHLQMYLDEHGSAHQ